MTHKPRFRKRREADGDATNVPRRRKVDVELVAALSRLALVMVAHGWTYERVEQVAKEAGIEPGQATAEQITALTDGMLAAEYPEPSELVIGEHVIGRITRAGRWDLRYGPRRSP